MQLSRDELRRAYERMYLIRVLEERIEKEFYAGNIPGFVHISTGQEASAVGVCFDLTDDDYIGSTHRGHGHCVAKGVDIDGMMLEIMGKAEGVCGGKGGSMHIADLKKGMLGANAIVGGAPPIAVGAALTQKLNKTGNVAVAFTGDGGANQGTVFEALNMAVVLKVPAIFAFENNQYGEYTHHSYASGGVSIPERVRGFGMPCLEVDGTDFFAVRTGMQEALEHARSGKGPFALEIHCRRFSGHWVGDPQTYRSEQELAEAQTFDPVSRFRKSVSEAQLLSEQEFEELEQAVHDQVESSVRNAMAAAAPDPDKHLTKDVYVKYS